MIKRRIRNRKNCTQGFTLLEVMIAISIFGLLLLYASQFLRSEIHVLESVSRQNQVVQKARIAMMHMLDEVRLHNLTYYKSTSNSQGIYRYADVETAVLGDESGSICLIFLKLQPSAVMPPSTKVFFDKAHGELWYRNNGSQYLIADGIYQLSIEGSSSLVKIELIIDGDSGSEPYELLTWVRLN